MGGGNAAEVLQQAMLPITRHTTCRKKMDFLKVSKKQMVCAGGKGKGGCHVRIIALSHLSTQARREGASLSKTLVESYSHRAQTSIFVEIIL